MIDAYRELYLDTSKKLNQVLQSVQRFTAPHKEHSAIGICMYELNRRAEEVLHRVQDLMAIMRSLDESLKQKMVESEMAKQGVVVTGGDEPSKAVQLELLPEGPTTNEA